MSYIFWLSKDALAKDDRFDEWACRWWLLPLELLCEESSLPLDPFSDCLSPFPATIPIIEEDVRGIKEAPLIEDWIARKDIDLLKNDLLIFYSKIDFIGILFKLFHLFAKSIKIYKSVKFSVFSQKRS